ncbi:Retrovirus-related Pol polyprotein from type-2 retrotransposable element R2DM [Portunus trituberculatus]|uniref:Retrovirus-related Pol polyprotein from type-2 retrotransposable element R2DM n=1 Tax=Portunus trituberculatus TaxID=210409 RepID=A0A5B7FS59_PORTR|nr:Retrovirus-related Pol polyprotein from type-2 retrotransposable element R2DM [Portunus trituberculatus]
MAANNVDRSPTCPTCLRTFSSYRGRAHERSQHPLSYHDTEVAALRTEVKKARRDPEELAMMANFEAKNFGARNINTRIKTEVLPHRSIEGIKGARRAETYKALVRQAALPQSAASMLAPRSPPLPVPSTTSEGPPVPNETPFGSPIIPISPGSAASGSPATSSSHEFRG